MSHIWWLTLNILKVNFRKFGAIITFFLLPVCGILLSFLVYGHSGSVSLKIGMIDGDQSVLSRDLVRSLGNGDQFKIIPVTQEVMANKLSAGELDCVVIIPSNFGASIYREPVKPIILVSVKGAATTVWIKNDIQTLVRNLQDIRAAAGGSQEAFKRIYERYQSTPHLLKAVQVRNRTANQGMTTQIIGFFIMFMMISVGNTSELILREKRWRIYYRICAAPISTRKYLLANVLANLVIIMIQTLLTLLLMTKVFGIDTYAPFVQVFAILTLFGLVAISAGLLIVAFSQDTGQANNLINLIITPSCMLAGCLWPNFAMPKVIQQISDFLPQRWTISAIQKLQEGSGFNQIWIHIGIIAAFALAFFLIAAYRFNRNDEVKTFI